MEYKYIITSEKRKEWDKENFGADYNKLLNSFLRLNTDIQNGGPGKASILKDDFILTKHNGKRSRPTFVWQRIIKDDYCFYVFRAAYRHDEYQAEIKQGKISNYIEKKQLTEFENDELDKISKNLKEKRNAKPQIHLQPLSSAEFSFISSLLSINHTLFKDPIYETKQWVEDITSEDDHTDAFDEFSLAAQEIENYILTNIDNYKGWGEIKIKERTILIYHKDDSWILAGAPYSKDKIKIDTIKQRGCPSDFLRGYPFSFLNTRDEWRRMEKESKSNLVLTEEQVQVVACNEPNYPLFISGRAGSGKSTVLQYLFAEVFLRYLTTKKQAGEEAVLLPPVYLSYSKTLINDAKKLSSVLYEKNTTYTDALKRQNIDYKTAIQPVLDKMFYVFRDLQKQCINKYNPEILNVRFADNKYISFAAFKRKWFERFAKEREIVKKCGPSICWHVIRTYIKGWNADTVTTPEDYNSLGRNYVTVTQETYKFVYDNIWEKWYKELTEEDYWDDQDIVKFCLENKYVDERFSAIYCDEAQDFTRIEIDFILKISSFSNRMLDNVDNVRKLPFVFAGDEFQTLNPTGFSWDSLRSYFVDRIFKMTGLEDKGDKSNLPRPIEFNENFRSTSQIVQLANRIQLLRASRLGEYSKPQIPHFAINGPSIRCISPTCNQSIWKAMGGATKLVNMIVPVAEGESVEEYIKNSPLKDKINFESGIPQGLTILTPAQAKGCEYANVILYGFNLEGVNSEFGIDNLLNWFSEGDKNNRKEEDIELKYQICNAYVAATRATSRLYILDEFNRNSFWAFAFNDCDNKNRSDIIALQNKMLDSLNNKKSEWSGDNLLGWINEPPTEEYAYFDDMTIKDIREELDRTKKNAEMREDSAFMRMVACRYKERNNSEEYYNCLGKAFVYEGNYIEAANQFFLARNYLSALDYYWKEFGQSSSTDKVLKLIKKLEGKVDDIRLTNCCNIGQLVTVTALKNVLADAITYLNLKTDEDPRPWQVLIEYVLSNVKPGKEYASVLTSCFGLIDNLKSKSVDVDANILAMLAYRCGLENEAMKLWEQLSDYPSEYYAIKYKKTPYPKNLEYAQKAGNSDWANDVLRLYHDNKKQQLTLQQKQILSIAIHKVGSNDDFKLFLPFMLQDASDEEKSLELMKEAANRGVNDLNVKAIDCLTKLKFGQSYNLNIERVNFEEHNTTLFFKAIEVVRKIQTKDFQNSINAKINRGQERINSIISPFKQYANTPLAPLVLMELGKILELREKKIDVIIYYEQIKSWYGKQDFKDEVERRWILAKETLAEKTNNPQPFKEAKQKRIEMGIEDVTIGNIPSLSRSQWESLYEFAMNLSMNEVKKDTKNIEVGIEVHDDSMATRTSAIPVELSTKKQVLNYGDYKLTYFPRKKELKIEYISDELEYSVKITKGIFPENGDFVLKDDRVYIDETETMTPFVIIKTSTTLIVDIFDGDKPTGISLTTLL